MLIQRLFWKIFSSSLHKDNRSMLNLWKRTFSLLLGLVLYSSTTILSSAQLSGVSSLDFEVLESPLVSVNASMPYLLRNENVTLACQIGSSEGLDLTGADFQWFRNDKQVPQQGQTMFRLHQNKLTIIGQNKLRDVDGHYVCAVRLPALGPAFIVQSSHFLLKAAMIKKFEGDLRDKTVRVSVGSTVFMPCDKPQSYPGPLEISFKYGHDYFINKNSGDRYFIGPNGLQITNLTREDGGMYKCVVKNMAKDQKRVSPRTLEMFVTENSAEAPVPRIVFPYIKQTSLRVFAGSNVTMECVVSGPEGIRANWTKMGEELPENHVKQFGNLNLFNVNTAQSGTYLCRVDADRALSSRPFVVYILSVEEHLAVDVSYGWNRRNNDLVQLTCQANKKSRLELTVNGKNVLSLNHLISHSDLKTDSHPRWSIDLKQPVQPGVYQCVATTKGPGGVMESQTDSLIVLLPDTSTSTTSTAAAPVTKAAGEINVDMLPKIRTPPRNSTNFVGATVLLTCSVEMATAAFWLKDDSKLVLDHRMRTFGSASLNIDGVVLTDSGKYSCVAVNPFGNSTASAWLSIVGTDSELFWIPFENDRTSGQNPPPSYVPQGSLLDALDSHSALVPSAPFSKHIKPSSGSLDVATGGAAVGHNKVLPLAPPMVHRLSDNSVMLIWDVNQDLSSAIRLYVLQYKQVHPEKRDWQTVNINLPSDTRSHVINQLEPDSKYRFRVSVVLLNDSVVTGQRTSPFFLNGTAVKPPSQPPIVTSTKVLSATAVKLFWELGTDEAVVGFLIKYRTYYKSGSKLPFMNTTVPDGSAREAVVSRLLPATSYEFYIAAFNTGGLGSKSKPEIASTLTKNGKEGIISFESKKVQNFESGVEAEEEEKVDYPEDTNGGRIVYLFKGMESDLVLIIAGSVVGLILVISVVCSIACACKQRKKKKMMKESKGKYKDASRRIYREQSFSKSKYPYSDVTSDAQSQQNGMTGYEGLMANNLTSVNLYPNPLDQYSQQVESEADISDSDDPNVPLTSQTDASYPPDPVTLPFPANYHDSAYEHGGSLRRGDPMGGIPAYPPMGGGTPHSASPLQTKPPPSPGGSSSDQRTGTPYSFVLPRQPPSVGDQYGTHLFPPSPGHGLPPQHSHYGGPPEQYGRSTSSNFAPSSPAESLGQLHGGRTDTAPSPATSEEHPHWMRNLSPHASLSGRRRVIPSHEVSADPVQFNTFRPQRSTPGVITGNGTPGGHYGPLMDTYGLCPTPTSHNQSFSNHSES